MIEIRNIEKVYFQDLRIVKVVLTKQYLSNYFIRVETSGTVLFLFKVYSLVQFFI